jgi:hypothetical protein
VRAAATLTLAGAVPAALGGIVYWAAVGGTRATRAVAYGFWFAAAVLLLAMVLAAQRVVWQRTPVTPPEGWAFVTAAIALTAIGMAIDVAGT